MTNKHYRYKIKTLAVRLNLSLVDLYEWLRKEGIVLKTNGQNIPADRYLHLNWFVLVNEELELKDFTKKVTRVLVTQKGLDEIIGLYKRKNSNQYDLFE